MRFLLLVPAFVLAAHVACTPTGKVGDTAELDDDDDDDDDSDPDADEDGDGVKAADDCDDNDDDTFPGAEERCDGDDNDCDGEPHALEADDDGDGDPDCEPCDEAGYWAAVRDADDADALDEALREVEVDCNDYTSATIFMFTNLDKHDGEVECVYTGRTTSVTNQKPSSDDMNTEHSWPQSFGADANPARCDVNHLFPTDTDANGARGNTPYGEVNGSTSWSVGGSKLGSGRFEPRDSHKGDAARAMLYFHWRYGDDLSSNEIGTMLDRSLFESWSEADPPDDTEIERAIKIGRVQGAANPFVVCPSVYDTLY